MSAKREYRCEACGTAFMQWPSQIAARTFCSRACYAVAQRSIEPHNKGRKTVASKPCANCGKTISGEPSQVSRRKYCSKECTARAFSSDTSSTLEKYTVRTEGAGCWIWIGAKRGGYGRFKVAGQKSVTAHRASYELHVGPIPEGMQLDHLCRNPACVNPSHLEPVSAAENVRRGDAGKGPRSEAHKSAVAAAMLARYQDPIERAKQAERLALLRDNPNRLSELRKVTSSPEYRAMRSAIMKRIWADRKARDHGAPD